MDRASSHDWMVGRADRGCLVVADISGYTKYLQGSELEHAQDVLADLTETVVKNLRPVLTLSKLEGDAAFAYAPEERIEASMLLDGIDECYFAFQSRRRDITQATTCDCNACLLIPGLNLKFVAHHGSFARRPIAGREELTGTDVILVHRLLKNSVTETLGLRGYALFTEACIAALGIEPSALEMKEHRESYGNVGEVRGYVEDLEARWRYEEERRRVYVVREGAAFEFEDEYPVPPHVLWEYTTSPSKRQRWQNNRIDQANRGGRRGVGTTNHCVHGRTAFIEEILDWRPFRYFTDRTLFPGLGPWVWTTEFEPTDGGTRLRMRGEALRGRQRLIWWVMRPMLQRTMRQNSARLKELLEREAVT